MENAIITHAHSDHARPGNSHYLTHKDSEAMLRMRLGEQISLRTVAYGETFTINGVKFSLHPAGHIIGSAQIRVEFKDEVCGGSRRPSCMMMVSAPCLNM